MQVRTEDGREFRLGTGFSAAQRRHPPAIGSVVSYRFRELTAQGIPTIYPRAIYMCGIESERLSEYASDLRRYETHRALKTPDGRPLLSTEHNYLTVWGYWNGVDSLLAEYDQPLCEGINLRQAVKNGFITTDDQQELLDSVQAQVKKCGYEFVELKPTHFLLSLRPDNTLVLASGGALAVRICNFESLRRL